MSSNECAGLQTQYDVFSLDKAETLALLHGCGFSYEELKKPRVAENIFLDFEEIQFKGSDGITIHRMM